MERNAKACSGKGQREHYLFHWKKRLIFLNIIKKSQGPLKMTCQAHVLFLVCCFGLNVECATVIILFLPVWFFFSNERAKKEAMSLALLGQRNLWFLTQTPPCSSLLVNGICSSPVQFSPIVSGMPGAERYLRIHRYIFELCSMELVWIWRKPKRKARQNSVSPSS